MLKTRDIKMKGNSNHLSAVTLVDNPQRLIFGSTITIRCKDTCPLILLLLTEHFLSCNKSSQPFKTGFC